MALERTYSLRQAATILGIARRTLRKWLLSDLALAVPEVPRGSHLMIRQSDLERLMECRGLQVNWQAARESRGRIRVRRVA